MNTVKRVTDDQYAIALRAVMSKMFLARGDGHIGGSFSIADVMAVLFNGRMRKEPEDWFVLSKGHAGPAYYAALYLEGKITDQDLLTLNANGTILPSHPDRNLTPGVQCSTGSLGQGISQAVGLAYANKLKKTGARVYCIIGDGELNEGETYEALEFASNKKLNNLIIFLDANKKQVDGLVDEVSCEYCYESLFEGLHLKACVTEGNDPQAIEQAIEQMETMDAGECHVIVLDTIKGKGIPYFEQALNCHHVTFNDHEKDLLAQYIKENEGVVRNVLEAAR